jgi:hypothetical protein
MGQQMLITEKQLADRWGYSPATLRKWRVEGRGPDYVKIGHGVRYSIETIEEVEKKNIRCSTSDTGGAA